MNEWGMPISKDKIIARRNRLIEYQKIGELRFTPLYEAIDENILDINYMLHEIDNLQSKIDKANEILNKLCIYGYGQVNCRPIKNTTKQEVYNAMYEIKNVLKEVENVENN